MEVQNQGKRHRFLSLQDETEEDVFALSERSFSFLVSYVGSTCWREDFTCVEDLLVGIFPRQAEKFWTRKSSHIKVKLSVDISGVVVHADYKDVPVVVERFDLSNISEIIYCGHAKEYEKHVILIARGETDVDTKAHVMVCENVKKAKTLYQTFRQLFTLAVKTTTREACVDGSTAKSSDELELNRKTCSVDKAIPDQDHMSIKEDKMRFITCSIGQSKEGDGFGKEQILPPVEDVSIENEFTSLARARSL